MTKHLGLSIRGAYESGATKHPQIIMKELGITYNHSTPQSIADEWWFWNCENIPDTMPKYLKELNITDPFEAIGNGLSKEDAIKIRDHNKYDNK